MKRLLSTVFLSSLVAACAAEPPDDGLGDYDPMEEENNEEETPQGVSLELDPPQSPTYWDTSVFTGRTTPGSTILVHSPVAGQLAPTQAASTGDFCIDVPLQLGATNTISFQAVSPDGQMSDMVIREVIQDGEPPEVDPGDAQLQLVPVGGTFEVLDQTTTTVEDNGQSGTFSNLFNGNENDPVLLDEDAFSNIDWMAFRLPYRVELHELDIIGVDICPGTDDKSGAIQDFDIYVSDVVDPAAPYYSGGLVHNDWIRVASFNDNTSADLNIVPSPQDTLVRNFAIHFRSNDCAGLFQDGKHVLSEIRLLSIEEVDDSGVPTDMGPSCANGGY